MNNRETLAQRTFVAGQRRYRRRIAAGRILLFFAFLAVWEAGADTGLLDDFIFSSPSRALRCFFVMASDGSVFPHLGATLLETVVSFFLVTALGLGGALALWESRTASDLLEPYLVMLNSLPKSALAPLLIVWLGSNMRTIVTAAVSVAVFGSVLTLYQGFLSMDPDQEKLIYSLGGTRRDVLRKGASAWFHPFDCQQHEGKRRTLPGRSHDRRISGRRQGAGLSDHLRKPGI